jgi:MFS transporter, AAHS family, vanillate permease
MRVAAAAPARIIDPPTTMNLYQWAIVLLCCLTNIADGFDVVSLSVAAPVLSKAWRIDPAVLGTMFSAVAVGLVIGAFVVAPFADKIGRRPVMLGALGTLAACLLLTGICNAVWQLFALRFITGIGLGTLVVCLNTTAADHASEKSRNIAMALVHIGFTVGMMIGSGIAAFVLEAGGWRPIFLFAGSLNAITFLVSLFLLGESREFLVRRQAPGDLARLNRLNRRMGVAELAAMPAKPAAIKDRGLALRTMLAPQIRSQTILVWVASATYAVVGYFLLNWKPRPAASSPAPAAPSATSPWACSGAASARAG